MRILLFPSAGRLSLKELAGRTFRRTIEHELTTRAAAISFYGLAAAVPVLAILLTLIVNLLPAPAGYTGVKVGNLTIMALQQGLHSFFPHPVYHLVEKQIARIQSHPPVGLLSVGLLVSLWVSSSLFMEVIKALNKIFAATESRPMWKLRLLAIFMAVVEVVILLCALVTVSLWPQILTLIGFTAWPAFVLTVVHVVVLYLMVMLSFALVFHMGPASAQRVAWVTPGSLLGSTAFLLACFLFRAYVEMFGRYGQTYGSLGGTVVLLLWFWLTAMVLLVAAEVNAVIDDAGRDN